MSSTVSATTTSGIPAQPTTGQLQQRLVPALIGPEGSTQTVWIECPQWCLTDHREYALGDVVHYGDCGSVVEVPSLTLPDTESHCELMSAISCDPTATDERLRSAHVVVVVGETPLDAYATPEQAEQLAGQLDVFAQQLRRQARTVRAHNSEARS